MHKLQIPAVIRPIETRVSSGLRIDREPGGYVPQTILVLPPEGKLRDKLADKAVHDCQMSIVDSHGTWFPGASRTFRMAKARPSIELQNEQTLAQSGIHVHLQHVHQRVISLQLRLMAQLGQLSLVAIVFFFVHIECCVSQATSDGKKRTGKEEQGYY